MTRREADLILAVASSLALVFIILALPSAKPVRVILGLPFIFVLPGYTLTAALFPRKDQLDVIERAALSFGLSIAVVPLLGLALNYSYWGVRLQPILAFLTLLIVLAAAAAAYRRRLLPAQEAFGIPVNAQWPRWSRFRVADRLLALTLVLSLTALGVAAYFVVTSRSAPETFTEFYVLGSGGKAEAYPGPVTMGERATVILGLANREGQDTAYRIEVRIDGSKTDEIDKLVVADGERWEKTVSLLPVRAGENQKVEFLLYKDGGSEPYRSLRLSLDVEGAPADVLAQEQTPAPVEETEATPAAPQYRTHRVEPGENLSLIADFYGVPLETLVEANQLDDPRLIHPNQEILIPTSSAAGESE